MCVLLRGRLNAQTAPCVRAKRGGVFTFQRRPLRRGVAAVRSLLDVSYGEGRWVAPEAGSIPTGLTARAGRLCDARAVDVAAGVAMARRLVEGVQCTGNAARGLACVMSVLVLSMLSLELLVAKRLVEAVQCDVNGARLLVCVLPVVVLTILP